MPKRSNESSKRTGGKRVKKEQIEPEPIPTIRDPNYYFQDGGITIRVRLVVFKVHGSLLKAHSEDFCNEYHLCPDSDDSMFGGTCDEDAILIPDVEPSQFRNLMKVIYCLPSNSLALTLNSPSAIVGNFDSCLDIALLSRKFGMQNLEEWAKQQLSTLVNESGKDLADRFDDFYHENDARGRDDSGTSWDGVGIAPPEAYDQFRFVEAIRYAQSISDKGIFHGTLAAMQCYYSPTKVIDFILSFFRIKDLHDTVPSLFGFLFLLLLHLGNSAWMEDQFTQDDRMALFSTQSFLTPLPKKLKQSLLTPLFEKSRPEDFVGILEAHKNEKCPGEVALHWARAFPASYYKEVNGAQFSVSAEALVNLPSRRFDLTTRLRGTRCQSCRLKVLKQLDRDMQTVYVRLAGYYTAHNRLWVLI